MQDSMVDIIEAEGVPEEEEQQQRFQIASKDEAAWALRKMSALQAKIEENDKTAQAELVRTNAWKEAENKKLQGSMDFFTFLLEDYFRALREADPKLKTLSLPHGKLKVRAQQPEYVIDERELIPWLKENNVPGALVLKETVSKAAIKSYVKDTGEVPIGVEIIDRPDKFSVEVE
jgi:hypothetical protein